MRSIAIMNQKGGVGKTTTAVNLSAAIADAGFRVCLVDLDPQAHASLHLGISLDDSEDSIYRVLLGDLPISEIRVRVDDHLWVVPSHIDLAAAEMELAAEVGREIILRNHLQYDDDQFDYLILDCPPSLGVLTLNALTAAQEVFLPLQPHFLALHGLSKLLRTIQIVTNRLNQSLRLSGVIYCMYETGTKLAAEVVNDVDAFFAEARNSDTIWSAAKSFETKVRRNIRLAEAPSFGQSIFQYAPQSNGALDYKALALEVLNGHQPSAEQLSETAAAHG